MSKAILVIDMPKSCDECDFIDAQYHYCNIPWFGKEVGDYVACRHEECPLKPIPKKKDSNKALTWEHKKVIDGFNLCIDRISSNQTKF